MAVQGTATLNFGTSGPTARRASATVDVTGQSGLTASSYIEAFAMTESTADHTADVARVDPLELSCAYLSASSFRIYGTVARGHTYGDRKIRWVTA